MKKNLLVTLADDNYIDQAKQLFSSVYWNAGWKGDYLLLAYDIPNEKLHWFIEKGIIIKKCEKLPGYEFKRPTTGISKFKLFAPDFKNWRKIIYLDGDIIVRSSLDELTNVQNFAAVKDLGMPKLYHQFKGIKEVSPEKYDVLRTKYDLSASAFNAGMFAFDTEIINQNTHNKLLGYLNEYMQPCFVDQPILNMIFYKKWQKLPLIYNVQMHFVKKAYKIRNIKGTVLHFTCKNKPWISGSKFCEEWQQNLKNSEKIDLSKKTEQKNENKYKIYYLVSIYKINHVFYLIDKLIGKIGGNIRKRHPKIYNNLRKIIYGK
ncbi:MAG: hypothetical protein K9N40_09930 [Candidatus Cloacimonetes bacterium]|nr:hypothetical protein [Candidatus Cloacimonadota bacterium]